MTDFDLIKEEEHPKGGPCWANYPDTEPICQGRGLDKKKCLSFHWKSTGKKMCHWNDTTQGTGCPDGEVQHADGSCHCPEGMHWSNDTNDGACIANSALAQRSSKFLGQNIGHRVQLA